MSDRNVPPKEKICIGLARFNILAVKCSMIFNTGIVSSQTTPDTLITPEGCPVPTLAPQSHHGRGSITFHTNGVTRHILLCLRSFTKILFLTSVHVVARISGSFSFHGLNIPVC